MGEIIFFITQINISKRLSRVFTAIGKFVATGKGERDSMR
jgi:hypothetical protein